MATAWLSQCPRRFAAGRGLCSRCFRSAARYRPDNALNLRFMIHPDLHLPPEQGGLRLRSGRRGLWFFCPPARDPTPHGAQYLPFSVQTVYRGNPRPGRESGFATAFLLGENPLYGMNGGDWGNLGRYCRASSPVPGTRLSRGCRVVVAWLPRVYPVCIGCMWRGCRMVVAWLPHGCGLVAAWLAVIPMRVDPHGRHTGNTPGTHKPWGNHGATTLQTPSALG